MTKKENLIKLYFYMCEDKDIQRYLTTMRMSNNWQPKFSDEEIMTIYIFCIIEGFSKVKQIYNHIKYYWHDWFPLLPSYQAFNGRLNNLSGCFEILVQSINTQSLQELGCKNEKIIDSLPIIVAGSSRSSSAKAASRICNKGYCSSKKMYYYGLKLHVTGFVRPGSLPMPQASWISAAGENDLTAARPMFESMRDCRIYGDKIYADRQLNAAMQRDQNSLIITPAKKEKAHRTADAADDTYSYLVSRIRQPIESLFNWIIEKTNIQFAQRIRSEKGLRVHVWGKFAAALCLLSNFLTLD